MCKRSALVGHALNWSQLWFDEIIAAHSFESNGIDRWEVIYYLEDAERIFGGL